MYTAYTIGYSWLTVERLLEILRDTGVDTVIDVRRFPRSRLRGFSREELEGVLTERGVRYVWLGVLGALGLRYRGPVSIECTGSPTFNSYVQYLVSSLEAREALRTLYREVLDRPVLILCREEDPRHCHRQFISDILTSLGVRVLHIRRRSIVAHEKSPCYEYLVSSLGDLLGPEALHRDL